MLTKIKSALDYFNLDYKEGSSYLSMSCPFASTRHESGVDRSPSFVIYPDKGFVKCFSCGIYFELFEFFSEYAYAHDKNVDFDFLESYNPLPRENKHKENVELVDHIFENFTKNSPKVVDYLDNRGIRIENLPFEVLYDHVNDQLVVPVKNMQGKVVGATSRNLKNWGNKSHHYFGMQTQLALLGLEKRDAEGIILVEGLTDVLNSYDNIAESGLSYNVYAPLTASLSQWQATKLLDMDKPIHIAFDLDKAGWKGRKTAYRLLKEGIVSQTVWKNRKVDMGNMSLPLFLQTFS